VLNTLTTFQQDRVKKAVCAHADFIYQYGPYLNMPISGYSAGSISLSFKSVEVGGIKTSEEVTNLLKATGLMDRRL
ncbi:MAG: head-tail connector protein, partial [Ruminiclostridium sp.]